MVGHVQEEQIRGENVHPLVLALLCFFQLSLFLLLFVCVGGKGGRWRAGEGEKRHTDQAGPHLKTTHGGREVKRALTLATHGREYQKPFPSIFISFFFFFFKKKKTLVSNASNSLINHHWF